MSTLSIALVSPYDYAYPGGVNQHIHHLARHLRARGHDVEILAPTSDDGPSSEEGFVQLDVGIFPLPISGSIARISISPSVVREVKSVFRRRYYDIVHLHQPTTWAIGPAVLHYSRSVNIGTFHQFRETSSGVEYGGTRVYRYFMDKLHGRIAVSTVARDFAMALAPGEYSIIPNGIEVAQFQALDVQPFQEYLDDGKLNILFVGRLEKRKGFRYLLRAFRIVKEAVPEARLIVAGAFEREDRETYVRYARHYRVRDVKFVGYVSEAEKARWYKTAHIFCAPSTGFESFGIVLLEAMAAGTPVVASDIAGYRDVVRHNVTGVLSPPEDDEALAETLIRLLRDPARRASLRAAALREVPRYDWSRVSGEVEAFYWELLAREGRIPAPIYGAERVGA